ncbi:MAG: hypothetical protein ACXVLT_05895 [Flavisolibacter sp.]
MLFTVEYRQEEHAWEEQQRNHVSRSRGHLRKVWGDLFSTNDGYQPLSIPIA